jgi:hypothetical protein
VEDIASLNDVLTRSRCLTFFKLWKYAHAEYYVVLFLVIVDCPSVEGKIGCVPVEVVVEVVVVASLGVECQLFVSNRVILQNYTGRISAKISSYPDHDVIAH